MKKITQWNEFNEKYKNEMRDFMTEEREREFVNDYCNCCEAEGFNKVYWSPYTEWEKYYGKPFKVIKRATEKENDLEVLPMWIIQFEDGKRIQAYPEEIVTSEMKRNECPKKYLNKKENSKMIKTWVEFKEKYDKYDYRENMSKEREREYVNDLFSVYENEGFNKVFWSPYSNEGEEKYYGKTFKVLGRCPETRNNLSLLPLWDIEFEDGKQLTVEPCEIFTKAMEENGCPKEYLIDTKLTNLEKRIQEKKEKENLEKNSLYAQLMLKLHQELFSYKESLYRMTVDEVIEEAYKLIMFKEFICVFEFFATNYLEIAQFEEILKVSNVLESLYERWLTHDSEEQEVYHEFVFGFWAAENL